ncbi:MAG: peptidase and chymotrypsin/Hap [Clostridia bacterium]|nr:peptidase and chymotrypsin/Hap [Clostridia bacterium]
MDENKENLNNENGKDQTSNQEIKSTLSEETPETVIFENPIQSNPPVTTVIKGKKQRNGLWMTISIISIALCVTSILFSVYLAASGNNNAFKFPAPYTPEYVAGEQLSVNDKMDTPSVIAKVKPSVVNILVELGTDYYGQSGSGSGIIFTKDGLIITNAHVVEGATSVKVTTLDGKEYTAEVIGYDSITDLAVIKIDATNLPAAEFGDSSKVVEGEQIIAIGNPYGIELSHTNTQGIISSIRNDFRFENLNLVLDLFQHDAAINPGNSGGPLVNMYGQVIGINSLKITGEYENIGFAIQINSALPIIESLINNGKVNRPVIGITGMTETTIGGVIVAEVSPGGSAALSGLESNDIITKIDNVRVKSIEELINQIGLHNTGDKVELTVIRDAEVMTFTLTLQASVPQQ